MQRVVVTSVAMLAASVFALPAAAQPPEGRGPGGPPRFQLGKVLPPFVREELRLTREQEKQLEELEKEVKQRLTKILTEEQRKRIETMRPPGLGGPGGPSGPPRDGDGGPPERREPSERPAAEPVVAVSNLVKNPRFTQAGANARLPAEFLLTGAADWVHAGHSNEFADWGVALHADKPAGSVTQDVIGFTGGVGKWFRFSIRGLAEPNFALAGDDLLLKVDYFGRQGTNPLDGVTRKIYPLIERDRQKLAANGIRHKNGGAVWKTYVLEFRLPFAEIDLLRSASSFAAAMLLRHGMRFSTRPNSL